MLHYQNAPNVHLKIKVNITKIPEAWRALYSLRKPTPRTFSAPLQLLIFRELGQEYVTRLLCRARPCAPERHFVLFANARQTFTKRAWCGLMCQISNLFSLLNLEGKKKEEINPEPVSAFDWFAESGDCLLLCILFSSLFPMSIRQHRHQNCQFAQNRRIKSP